MTKEHISRRGKTAVIAGSISILLLLLASSLLIWLAREHTTGKNSGHSGTASISATVSASPSPVEPLFSDTFTGANKGWSLGQISGYTRMLQHNRLILADSNHTVLTESLPTATSFDNFSLTVTFTIQEAGPNDSVGVYIRGDSNLDHDYRFDVSGNNMYAMSKEYLDSDKLPQTVFLIAPTSSPLLHAVGQQNTITIVMNLSQIILKINDTTVNAVSDSAYTNGQIALFVKNSAFSNEVKAAFSKIVVYPVPQEPQTVPPVK